MYEMIFTSVTHYNINDIILRSWSILFDKVAGHAAQRVCVWCHLTIFKCQPRWNDRSAPYFALFWVCSTSESAFLYVCFCFAKAADIFFAGYELPSSIFCFWSEIFCWTFGPADWRFLSDIMKKCPIVRRISTALMPLANHIAPTTFLASFLNTYFEVNRLRIFLTE